MSLVKTNLPEITVLQHQFNLAIDKGQTHI